MVETRNVSWSVVLHVTVLLIALVGLPSLLTKTPDPVPMVMSVELLPISDVSNVKPSDQPIQKAQNKPVTPTPPAPKAPATPTPPAPTPPPPKTFDPDEGAEKKDKIKPVEKPPEPPKPTIDQKQSEDFNKILADMKLKAEKDQKATPAPVPDAKDKANVAENKTKSDAPYNDAIPMSMTEKDAIRSQFIPCWRAPIGAKDAANLVVKVKVQVQADGTVLDVHIIDSQLSRYNSDTFFRAAADSAVRAVHICSPLKNLPADKYNSWKDMELTFDPKDSL